MPFPVVGPVQRLNLGATPTVAPPSLTVPNLEFLRSQAPDDPVYATVKVGGEVVATLHKSGAAVTSNASYGRLRNLPSMGESETLTGQPLAQKRAEEIAAALGGRIEIAQPSVANTAASAYAGVTDARFETQRAAQGSGVYAEFLALIRQNPMERLRAQMLESLGYDEASLAELPPEERAAVEDKVRELIEEKLRESVRAKGYLIDGAQGAPLTEVLA